MNVAESPSEVSADELLARYVLTRRHVREDGTIKPDALMPHPHTDLSVSRHALATIEGIWKYGQLVAQQRERELIGRADLHTMSCLDLHLRVKAAPLPDNPSHANVTSWPPDKKEQKRIAIQLAATAVYVRYAPETLGSGPE